MNIVNELEKYVKDSKNQYSSFIEASRGAMHNYKNRKEGIGGSYSEIKLLKKPIHYLFQILIYGFQIFKTKEYKIYKNLFQKLKRQMDESVFRHIFTLKMLNEYSLIKNKVCVIGDGQLNCIGGLINLKKPNLQIYSINLAEMLIHDYLSLKHNNLLDDQLIKVVNKEEDLYDNKIKLFLIDASNWKLLKNKDIDLFINIASMQEMTKTFVNNYFNVIKSNNSYFYCCNRKYKQLPDGEELIFNEYPWGEGEIIFKEICEWHKKYYDSKFPYIKNHNEEILHALVKF